MSMDKKVDEMLGMALRPSEEPDHWLNQRIINRIDEEEHLMTHRKIKNVPAFVLVLILVLALGTVGAVAAWKYLTPQDVADHLGDGQLGTAFAAGAGEVINETQTCGDYDVTLLGTISGKNLSKYVSESDGQVLEDRTYAAIAIARTDGAEVTVENSEFFASPLIQGYEPWKYNAFWFNGGYQSFTEDGVLYWLLECDNVEIFAEHTIYLMVGDGGNFNRDAYDYDEATGVVSRNQGYEGVNALFTLPVDPAKADAEAAEKYLQQLEEQHDGSADEDVEDLPPGEKEIRAFVESLTPENIDEKCERVESTVQTLTPDADGNVDVSWTAKGGSGEGMVWVGYVLEQEKPGMAPEFSYSSSGTLDTLCIETYTKNADDTVTFAIYVPKL